MKLEWTDEVGDGYTPTLGDLERFVKTARTLGFGSRSTLRVKRNGFTVFSVAEDDLPVPVPVEF